MLSCLWCTRFCCILAIHALKNHNLWWPGGHDRVFVSMVAAPLIMTVWGAGFLARPWMHRLMTHFFKLSSPNITFTFQFNFYFICNFLWEICTFLCIIPDASKILHQNMMYSFLHCGCAESEVHKIITTILHWKWPAKAVVPHWTLGHFTPAGHFVWQYRRL